MSEGPSSQPLEREDAGDVTVLRVRGPLLRGDETTSALFDQMDAVVDAGRARLVLNFAGVEFLASAGLGRLAVLVRKARSAGGRLVVCRLSRTLETMLRVTHLTELVPVYEDEQEAVRSFV